MCLSARQGGQLQQAFLNRYVDYSKANLLCDIRSSGTYLSGSHRSLQGIGSGLDACPRRRMHKGRHRPAASRDYPARLEPFDNRNIQGFSRRSTSATDNSDSRKNTEMRSELQVEAALSVKLDTHFPVHLASVLAVLSFSFGTWTKSQMANHRRSSLDDYCPPEDVELIQTGVLDELRHRLGNVDIKPAYQELQETP